MTLDDFFNLDLDLDLSDVIVEEKEEEVSPAPIFSAYDFFDSWYLSQEVETYLVSNDLPKYALQGALREIRIAFGKDIDLRDELLDFLLSLVIEAKDLEIYTQKSPRLVKYGWSRDYSKSKTLTGDKVSLLANLVRNALLGIDF